MKETQITAYALNELQREDRYKFESRLAGDEGLQGELQSVTRVADALEQIMAEPTEGLEPRAREELLHAMAANQEAFRARRKIVRFAVPVSLAAAASIAVLLWVTGGTTHQGPAVAADGAAKINNSGENFAASISAEKQVFVFKGSGKLSTNSFGVSATSDSSVVFLSENAKVAQQASAQGTSNTSNPRAVRIRSLLWETPQTLGQGAKNEPNGTEVFAQ